MPNYSLIRHADTHSPVEVIEVDLARTASGLLELSYHVSGAIGRVTLPRHQPSLRADELWKHSCFEAFIAADGGYYEFNFSPSSQWAAYRFDTYRAGMRDAVIPAPAITWRHEESRGQLSAAVQLPLDATGSLGLSAVIEDLDGNRSFWALDHAPGPPDFHHPACFAAQLPPAS